MDFSSAARSVQAPLGVESPGGDGGGEWYSDCDGCDAEDACDFVRIVVFKESVDDDDQDFQSTPVVVGNRLRHWR